MKNNIEKKNGKYYGKIKIKGVQRHFLCHGAKNEKEAREIIEAEKFQLRQEIAGLVKPKNDKIYTIKFLFDKLLKYDKDTEKKTYQKDLHHSKILIKYFKDKKLEDISLIRQRHIQELQQYLKNTPLDNGKRRKNSTVNRYIASLKTAFNLVVNDENIPIYQNPCKGVKCLTEDNRRTIYLPKHLQEKFFNLLPEQVRDIVMLDLHTGLRTGNVFNAHKSEFDISDGYWTIPKNKNKGKKFIRIKLNKTALEIVKKYYHKTEDYLFKNSQTNRPITTIRKAFKTAATKIGMPELQPRDLRRTVGTILIQNGKSLRVVRDILHHSNVSTTERYLGITPEELNSAYDSLDD